MSSTSTPVEAILAFRAEFQRAQKGRQVGWAGEVCHRHDLPFVFDALSIERRRATQIHSRAAEIPGGCRPAERPRRQQVAANPAAPGEQAVESGSRGAAAGAAAVAFGSDVDRRRRLDRLSMNARSARRQQTYLLVETLRRLSRTRRDARLAIPPLAHGCA